MTLKLSGVLIIVFFAALVLTDRLRRYALKREMIDQPNPRGSHKAPTPRGGGLSVVIAFTLGLTAVRTAGFVASEVYWALTVGGLLVAGIGFADDHGHVPARWRLLVHAAAGTVVLVLLGGAPPLDLGWVRWDWGPVGWALTVLGLVWLINLYNFMDGIDGIAGVEAVSSTLIAGVLFCGQSRCGEAWVCWLTASAVLGFLYWNWPPARIFMGDGGSGFLGCLLGTLALAGAREGGPWIVAWLILLGVFVVDATVTLVRRLFRGVKIWQAHREHAYQKAAWKWGHRPVTLAVLAVNLFWLGPLAAAAILWPRAAAPLLVVAWAPLVAAAFRLEAGKGMSE